MPFISTEIEASLLIEPLKIVIKHLYDNHKWFTIFKKAIKDNEGHDITSILQSDNTIKKISKTIKKSNGFGLKENLYNEFSNIFLTRNIDINKYSKNVGKMIDAIISGLKRKFPEIYKAYIQDDSHDKIDAIYNLLIQNNNSTSLSNLNAAINRFELNNYSEIKITIDFFDFNDIKAEQSILKKIENKDNIFIKYYCIEEALLRICNLLKKHNIHNAIVINNLETWEQFYQSNEKGYILIPNFQYQKLRLIEDNINIILNDGTNYHENDDEYIELKRRTKKNIVGSLVNVGIDYESAYKYVKETNGLYYPLMTRLLKNKYVFELRYDYDSVDKDAIQYLVLINKFTTGDIGCISKFFKIDDPEKIIKKYLTGPNPLFIERRGRDNKPCYYVAYYDSAFYQFTKDMSGLMFKRFADFSIKIIKKNENSKLLKNGVIDSLIKIYYSTKDNGVRSYIFEQLESFISSISNIKGYSIYSDILIELTSICPDSILSMLESIANENSDGLAKTITLYYGDLITIFKRLIIKNEYTKRTLKLCLHLYQYNESFKSLLNDVFCPWYNNLPSAFSNKKVDLAKWLFGISPKFMDILENSIPKFTQGTMVVWSEPDYIDEDIEHNVSVDVYRNTVSGYINLCLDNMNDDYGNIVRLLDDITVFGDDIIKKYISIVQNALAKFDDLQRAKYYYQVVRLINKHRYFRDSNWSMNDSSLILFEKLLNSIKYDSPEYEYYYLFERDYEGILLHPIPYKEDDYKQENDKLNYQLRLDKYKDFINRGYDIEKLISMYEGESCLGVFIAVTAEKEDLLDLLDIVVKNDKTPSHIILRRYCFSLNSNNFDNFELMANHIKKTTKNKDIIITILESFYGYSDNLIKVIDGFSDEIKKEYWEKRRLYFKDASIDQAKTILDRVIGYGNKSTYLDYLNDFVKLLDKNVLLHYLINLCNVGGNVNRNDIYDFETIIKSFIPSDLDDEQCKALAKIEIGFSDLLEWENMVFTNYCFSKFPNYYVKLILNNFNKDIAFDDKYLDEHFTYSLFYKAHFCPGVINNVFDESVFKMWVKTFYDELKEYYDEDFIDDMIGRLLAFSPTDSDGFPPLKCIRNYIENKNSRFLNVAYVVSEQSKRGVYTVTEGVDEMRLSNKYKELADNLKELNYPVCSSIYDAVSRSYSRQSDFERDEFHE